MKLGLGKDQKLKSRKAIQALFDDGQSKGAYPVRAVWRVSDAKDGDTPVQLAVSVTKKRFKKAVDRNRIKRLMREAYRLNQVSLVTRASSTNKTIHLMLLFTGTEMPDMPIVHNKVRWLLKKVGESV